MVKDRLEDHLLPLRRLFRLSPPAESSYAAAVDSLAPKGTTLVVLMGVNTRAQIAGRLIARGWSDATPVALLFAGWAWLYSSVLDKGLRCWPELESRTES